MKPLLIVMLTYNEYALTADSIRSVLASDFKNGGEPLYDLLVVDNHSADGSYEKLRAEFPDVWMIRNEQNLGYAGGNNVGLRIAIEKKYTEVVLINNDTLFDPACFRMLVDAFAFHRSVGFAGPKVYYHDYRGRGMNNVFQSAGCWVNLNRGRAVCIGEGEVDHGQYDQCSITGYVNGCCIMMRTKMLEKIGLLDENLFIYWEETDLCERGRRAGYESIYVPEARMWHRVGATGGNPYLMTRNKFIYLKKYATPKQYMHALGWFAVDEAPRNIAKHIIHGDTKRLGKFVKGTVDGIRPADKK